MSLPSINLQQKDFGGGQLTASASRRDDSKLTRKGVRLASNCRLLNTGGVENRFGRSIVSLDQGRTETLRVTGNQKLRLQFSDGAVALRDDASGDLLASATGMPWTLDTVDEIKFGVVGRAITIAYRNAKPTVITLTSASAAMIDRLAGTIIFFNASVLKSRTANGFDGVTSQTGAQSTVFEHNSFVDNWHMRYGKDFSSNPQVIGSAKIFGPNSGPYVQSTPTSVTFRLCASQTAPDFDGNPTADTPGRTVLGTLTFTQLSTEGTPRTITSSDLTTAWKYVWIEVIIPIQNLFVIAELQFFTPSGAEAWSVGDFAFASAPSGGLAQPFYRFAQGGVTMTPGATAIGTGVTVAFSANVLQAGHVGCYFRYAQKQLECTAVSSPNSGTFSILETLPPTIPTTVASTTGFAVGMVVVGATSGAEGIVSAVSSSTVLHIVMLSRYAGFVATESIVSSTGAITTITSVTTATTPEAIEAWDEGVLSDFRGWPGSVSADRDRLILCDVPAVPDAVLESKIGVYNDFLTGADATDSIFELCPGGSRVLDVIGGADQFVLTEDSSFYIPISAQSPLAPGFVDFRKIAAYGSSGAAPVQLKEGVVFIAANGKSVIGILPTFSSGAPWQAKDISEFYSDLFTGPIGLAVSTGGDAAAEQYLYVLNGDGTAIVGRYDQANEYVGFVPMSGFGSIKWISAFIERVYFNVLNGTQWTLENIDPTQFLDGAVALNTAIPALRPDPEDLTKGRLWFYAGLTVDLMNANAYLGARVVDADGNLVTVSGDDFSDAAVVAGFKWESQLSPFIPDEQEGTPRGQRMRKRRVKGAVVTVQDTTEFVFMGRTYAPNPSTGQPTTFTGSVRGRQMGRSYDPELLFRKVVPGPFRVVEIDGEVTT